MIGTCKSDETLVAHPAYGRDYETVEAAIADWLNGRDFHQTRFPGKYFSVRDEATLRASGIKQIQFCGRTSVLGKIYFLR